MDTRDIGERMLKRGQELRADGDRLASIGHALSQMEKPLSGIPGNRLSSDLRDEIERAWPHLADLLTDRLISEGVEITNRWPVGTTQSTEMEG